MFLYKKTPHPSRFARHLLPQEKAFYPLFLLNMQAQKKKLSKRKRRNEISRSAEHDEDSASSTRKPLKRLDLNFNEKSGRKKATDDRRFSLFLFFARFHYRQFFRFIGSRLCIFA